MTPWGALRGRQKKTSSIHPIFTHNTMGTGPRPTKPYVETPVGRKKRYQALSTTGLRKVGGKGVPARALHNAEVARRKDLSAYRRVRGWFLKV